MWTAEWKDRVEEIVNRFNESQEEYEVIPLSVPGGENAADPKFLLAISGGNPPDVICPYKQVIPSWVESNMLVALDDLMGPEELEEYKKSVYPVTLKLSMYKGKLYGAMANIDTWALFYNPQHFRQAGLDPDYFPDTIEELLVAVEKLHRFDRNGNLERVGFLPYELRKVAPTFGGGLYDWESGQITINTPENLAALNFLVDIRKKLGFAEVLRFESSRLSSWQAHGGDWPFMTGTYSIAQEGEWKVEQMRKFAPEMEYRTAPFPPPAGGKKQAGFAMGTWLLIPQGAHSIEGAWEFIKFWTGIEQPERAAEFYTWLGALPTCPAVTDAPIFQKYLKENPQLQTFVDMLSSKNLQAVPPVPYAVFLYDRLDRADDAAVKQGTLSPQESLEKLEKEIAQERKWWKELGYEE